MSNDAIERKDRIRGGGLLLAVLLVTAGLCALPGSSDGGRVLRGLWCFCGLIQMPLLFFLLGGWSRGRADTVPRAGRLASGFLLLWAVEEALRFWAAAPGGKPGFHLEGDGGSGWVFLALAGCLLVGSLLERRGLRGQLIALGCALVLGCLAGAWTGLGQVGCLDRLLTFLPLFLLGRWSSVEGLLKLLRRRTAQVAGGVALVAGLTACMVLPGGGHSIVPLLLGDQGSAGWMSALLRLGQYAASSVLGCAVLALVPEWALDPNWAPVPRRVSRWMPDLEERWAAAWFWLGPVLTLVHSVLPGADGAAGLVLLPVCGVLTLLIGGRSLAARSVERILALPSQLVDGVGGDPEETNRVYWRAFWAVFLVLVTAFSSYFEENGLSMVWSPDGQNLYLTIMYYTRDYVVQVLKTLLNTGTLTLPQWDFSIGQGSSVLSVFHFNPLFLLTLLAPYRWMEGMYSLITVIQIPLAGLAFTAYCRSIGRREPLSVLTGTVLYACSGFVIFTAAKHIYFITFLVIYFPLILTGCERWLRRRRWGLFVGMIFLSIVGGTYYAYINTALMACYLLIRELCLHWRQWRRIFLDLLQLVGLYLWGFLLAMPAFLPVVWDFFNSSRSDVAATQFSLLYSVKHYLWLLLRLVGSDPVGANWARLGFAGIVFTAGVVLFLRWKDRVLRPLQVGALACLFGLCVPLVGKVMNGFGYVSNRWTYGLAFCVALTVVFLLPTLVELRPLERIFLALLTTAYIAVVLLLELELPYVHWVDWGAMGLLALVTVAAIGCCHWKNKAGGQAVLAAVTVAAVLFNLFQFYQPENSVNLGDYVPAGEVTRQLYDSAEYVAKQEQLGKDSFARIETEANRNNRFCLTGGYGTTSYWSVLDAGMVNYCLDFNLNTVRQSYAVWGLDERASLCALAGVRYFVGSSEREDGKASSYQPYGFEKVKRRGKCTIYENQYALPVGYTYRGYMTRSDYEQLSPLARQQAILQGAVIEDGDKDLVSASLVRTMPRITTQELPYTVCEVKDATLTEDGTIEAEEGGYIRLEFDAPADAEIYVDMDNLTMLKGRKRGATLRVSGNNVTKKGAVYRDKSLYHFARDGVTFNLGASENGFHHCKITFEHKGVFHVDNLRLVALPMADYVYDVTALGQETLTDVKETGGTVSGSIHLDETRLLTLAIPCRTGWTLTVDGKRAEPLRVNGMYMGVLLEPGDHTVTASFRIPGLRAGLICSGVALVFTGITLATGALRRRRRAERGEGPDPRPRAGRRPAPPTREEGPPAEFHDEEENPFVELAYDERAERLRRKYAARRQQPKQKGAKNKGGARLRKTDRKRNE